MFNREKYLQRRYREMFLRLSIFVLFDGVCVSTVLEKFLSSFNCAMEYNPKNTILRGSLKIW